MKRLLSAALLLSVLVTPMSATTISPQIGGGINQFDGGISLGASTGTGPVCSASSGQLDLSVCSNIIYVPALIH